MEDTKISRDLWPSIARAGFTCWIESQIRSSLYSTLTLTSSFQKLVNVRYLEPCTATEKCLFVELQSHSAWSGRRVSPVSPFARRLVSASMSRRVRACHVHPCHVLPLEILVFEPVRQHGLAVPLILVPWRCQKGSNNLPCTPIKWSSWLQSFLKAHELASACRYLNYHRGVKPAGFGSLFCEVHCSCYESWPVSSRIWTI